MALGTSLGGAAQNTACHEGTHLNGIFMIRNAVVTSGSTTADLGGPTPPRSQPPFNGREHDLARRLNSSSTRTRS